jgi:hypothetical protein
MIDRDALYIDQLLSGIRSIKNFKPQFGQGRAVSQDEFQVLYSADPLYRWIGFDSPLMYAAHRAGGAMTSLYRHLGAGCEHLFQAVLRDSLGLTPDQIKWQYVVSTEDVQTFAGTAEPTLHAEDIAEIAGTAEDREEGEVPRKGKRNSLDGRIDPQSQLRGGRTQIGTVAARPFQSVGQRLLPDAPAVLDDVQGQIGDDAIDPRAERLAGPEPTYALIGFYKRLLGQILRIVAVPDDAPGD